MRKLLVIFLVLLLPFQFSWAAAAGYCQHEGGARAGHFGHHEHRHQADAGASKDATADDKAGVQADDPDCEYCHLSCAQPLKTVIEEAIAFAPAGAKATAQPQRAGAVLVDTIERPKWTFAD